MICRCFYKSNEQRVWRCHRTFVLWVVLHAHIERMVFEFHYFYETGFRVESRRDKSFFLVILYVVIVKFISVSMSFRNQFCIVDFGDFGVWF